MTTPMSAVPDAPSATPAAVPEAATRPFYWSARREVWENRSLYVAPLMAAGVFLFGSLVSAFRFPHRMRALQSLDAAHQRASVAMPYDVAAFMILLTAFLVGIFYALDALHGERRDRSILFWKSLPVSDRTTVLAKAGIPLVVLPMIVFVIILTTQLVVLMLSTFLLQGNAPALSMLWARLPLFRMSLALLYALTAISLWHAPLYAWLLLVSAWARRATFLWAVLPLLAIAALEKITIGTSGFLALLQYRLIGWFGQAFVPQPKGTAPENPLTTLDPGKFLSTPGLWLGLLFAAAFLAMAIRLRRNREPI